MRKKASKPYRRKGDKVYYFYYYDDLNPKKRIFRSTGETLLYKAEQARDEYMKTLEEAARPKVEKPKITTLVKLFAPYFTRHCPRQNTLLIEERPMGEEHMKAQRSLLKRFVFQHPIARKNKDDLTRGDIIDYVVFCKKKYGPSKTHSIMKAFKTCWKDCLLRGQVRSDIVAGLGNIKYEEKERDALTVKEEEAVFSKDSPLKDMRQRIAFLLSDKAGLRRSEILALPKECIDFEAHVIRINQAWKDYYKRKIGRPKWGKTRITPMCTELEDQLLLYFSAIDSIGPCKEVLYWEDGSIMQPVNFVIAWDDGNPISPNTWEDWFDHLKAELNAENQQINPDATPHWLRHTCATRWEEAGVPERLIRLYLGHSKEKTTKKYKHPSEEFLVAKLREKVG